MHRSTVAAVAAAIIFGFLGGCATPVSERSGTAYGKRVSLAGKTVMPMIVDTHVHLSETRDALIRD